MVPPGWVALEGFMWRHETGRIIAGWLLLAALGLALLSLIPGRSSGAPANCPLLQSCPAQQ